MTSEIVRFSSSYIEPYPLHVVGESHYRENLEKVSNYLGEAEGINVDDFIARLYFEDESSHNSRTAVRVEIDGLTIGHLSTLTASIYRFRLEQLGLGRIVGECYASIRGGFARRDGEYTDFSVRLDLDLINFTVAPVSRKNADPPSHQL